MYKNIIKLRPDLTPEQREYIINKLIEIHSIKAVVPFKWKDEYTLEFTATSHDEERQSALLGAVLVGSTEKNFFYLNSWRYEDEDPEESGDVIKVSREVAERNKV